MHKRVRYWLTLVTESIHMDSKNYHNHYSQIKLGNFLNRAHGDAPVESDKFKLIDIDHPSGWNFHEIDTLGDMGFKIDNDTDMVSEIEVPTLEMMDQVVPVKIYKDEDGYVLETHRRYVFESFEKLLSFIESVPSDSKLRGLK